MGRVLLLGFCSGENGAVQDVIADMVLVNRTYTIKILENDNLVKVICEKRHGHPMDSLKEIGQDFISVADVLKVVQERGVSMNAISRYIGKSCPTVLRWVNDRSFPDISKNSEIVNRLRDIYRDFVLSEIKHGVVLEFLNQPKKGAGQKVVESDNQEKVVADDSLEQIPF